MTTAEAFISAKPSEDLKPYRAISRSAVVSLIFAIVAAPIAVLTLIASQFTYGDAVSLGFWAALFSVFAIALGWAGIRSIRRYPNEYTGLTLARTGLVMGIVQFCLGVSLASFTYATEVPEGYTRVGFWELRPDPEAMQLGSPISQRAVEVQGQPIFIKGYMHPGVASNGRVSHFILVPDMGTCCFGGQPKPYDMIEIRVPEKSAGVAYSTRTLKLAGKFEVQPGRNSLGLQNVWYHLDVDQVR